MFPPPPLPKRGGGWKTFFLVVCIIGLGISLLLNAVLMVGSLLDGDASTMETVISSGDSSQKIVIVPVEGFITGQSAEMVGNWLKKIERDSMVKAVVLDVNTPGGEVSASDEIYNQVVKLKTSRGIPVIVTMGSLATSGGYYVSAPADYIFARPTTLTGNIGVRMDRFNVSELAKKWGVAESTLTAPEVGFKNAGSMFRPEDPKEKQYLQGLVNDLYAQFKGVVQKGRAGRLKGDIDLICNGQAFLGLDAKNNGLVDAVGDRDDAIAEATKRINVSNPRIVRFERRPTGLLDVLVGARMNENTGGISVNVDPGLIREMETPRFLYLWRPE